MDGLVIKGNPATGDMLSPSLSLAQRLDQMHAMALDTANCLDKIVERGPESDCAYEESLNGDSDRLIAIMGNIRDRCSRLVDRLGKQA